MTVRSRFEQQYGKVKFQIISRALQILYLYWKFCQSALSEKYFNSNILEQYLSKFWQGLKIGDNKQFKLIVFFCSS